MSSATMERVKFDRTNPIIPDGIYGMRSMGSRRMFLAHYHKDYRFSEAMAFADCHNGKRNVFLDAGCGGSADAALAVRKLRFESAIKVDLWEHFERNDSDQRAGKKFEGERVKFVQGDICKLTDFIEPNSIDLISCNAVLDLMNKGDRHQFYCEAEAVLAPGGTLIVSHINLASGHRDWVNGYQEWYPIYDAGLSFESVRISKHLLILRKEVSP